MAMENNNKLTKGRQKIEIKLIQEKDDRFVTFSKRRSGIYKKASELCTLCGTDIGIFITSPTGKPFSFAQPSIESIANRFLHQNPVPDNPTNRLVESYRQAHINDLNRQLSDLMTQSEAEKTRGEMLNQMRNSRNKNWWEKPIDQLSEEETEMLKARLHQIQGNLFNRLHQQGAGPSSSSQPSAPANGM